MKSRIRTALVVVANNILLVGAAAIMITALVWIKEGEYHVGWLYCVITLLIIGLHGTLAGWRQANAGWRETLNVWREQIDARADSLTYSQLSR